MLRKLFGYFFLLMVGIAHAQTLPATIDNLYSFSPPAGSNPEASLVYASDGNFYGTASQGGANNYGSVFRISGTDHTVTTIYSFTTQGGFPSSGLIEGPDGNLYGVAGITIYKITFDGTATPLSSDDEGAVGSLTIGQDGNLYGVANSEDHYESCGLVFRITLTGTFTQIYSFGGTPQCSYGDLETGLVQASDGNFYGAMSESIYQVTPSGTGTMLANLADTSIGVPLGAFVEGSDGLLYGVANGGTNYAGGAAGDVYLSACPAISICFTTSAVKSAVPMGKSPPERCCRPATATCMESPTDRARFTPTRRPPQ